MKEVFTKSFWEGVKKIFNQALEDPPPTDKALETPAESGPSVPLSSADRLIDAAAVDHKPKSHTTDSR